MGTRPPAHRHDGAGGRRPERDGDRPRARRTGQRSHRGRHRPGRTDAAHRHDGVDGGRPQARPAGQRSHHGRRGPGRTGGRGAGGPGAAGAAGRARGGRGERRGGPARDRGPGGQRGFRRPYGRDRVGIPRARRNARRGSRHPETRRSGRTAVRRHRRHRPRRHPRPPRHRPAPGPTAPAALTWGEPATEGTDTRRRREATVAFHNSGGAAVRQGPVAFGTDIIGALGIGRRPWSCRCRSRRERARARPGRCAWRRGGCRPARGS